MSLLFRTTFSVFLLSACGTEGNGPHPKDAQEGDSAEGLCAPDPTWICPELCDRMSCTGLSSDCIRDCTAELQDCEAEQLDATCDCFDQVLGDVVCQTWEAAQPDWDACVTQVACFDDY
jgi:hypothetical protein